MNKKTFIVLSLLCLSAIFLYWKLENKPKPYSTEITSKAVNVLEDPTQILYESETPLLFSKAGGFQVLAIAEYKISGKALAIKINGEYSDVHTPNKSIYPIDIGLIWGDVAESDYDKYIKYHHKSDPNWGSMVKSNQALIIDWKKDLPKKWTKDYVLNHISNNHIIPDSENVYNAICNLKQGEKVAMQGYLVKTIWTKSGHSGSSSLSRADSDCENFYVKRVQIENKIYE